MPRSEGEDTVSVILFPGDVDEARSNKLTMARAVGGASYLNQSHIGIT